MVNLADALHAQAIAEAACDKAYAASRSAEREVRRIPPYRIEHGRAIIRLDVARSNAEGAFEALQRARGAVWEALNPEYA